MFLHHVRRGHGPPLLLVHGIGHSLACWGRVAPELADGFECHAVDLPGFGGSPPLAEPPTMRALAHACARHMREHGHERFHVAGNSLGGGVALHLALEGIADSATALSPVGFAEGGERAFLQASLRLLTTTGPLLERHLPRLGRRGRVRRALFAQYLAHAERVPVAELVETLGTLNAATGFVATSRHALNWRCPAVGELARPITVAWGDLDRLLLYRPQAARARERLPGARHVTLVGVGHLPTLDDPLGVARVVRESAR